MRGSDLIPNQVPRMDQAKIALGAALRPTLTNTPGLTARVACGKTGGVILILHWRSTASGTPSPSLNPGTRPHVAAAPAVKAGDVACVKDRIHWTNSDRINGATFPCCG
jgi:hypothetical protein